MATKKATVDAPKLKTLPASQAATRESAALRMKKLAYPVCPIETDPEKPGFTGESNCQAEFNNYPGWWKECELRGHNPYFRTIVKLKKEQVVDDRETITVTAEDGTTEEIPNPDFGIVTGERTRKQEVKKLNVTQVAISTRINSGRGELYSKELKGRRDLEDFGYKPKCEYRNCENDAKFTSVYGLFCGDRHARLIGADVEGLVLHVKPEGKHGYNAQLKTLGDVSGDGTDIRIQEPWEPEGAEF